MDNNSTFSEPSYHGVVGMTYVIVFVIGIIILLLLVGTACVRLRMSQTLYIFNIMPGFPPSPRAVADQSEDMELGLRGNDRNSFESYPKLLYCEVVKRSGDDSNSSCSVCSSSTSSCSICLGDYKEADTLRLLPDCGHVFHLVCVDPWLMLHSTCPICRKSLLQSSTIESS